MSVNIMTTFLQKNSFVMLHFHHSFIHSSTPTFTTSFEKKIELKHFSLFHLPTYSVCPYVSCLPT